MRHLPLWIPDIPVKMDDGTVEDGWILSFPSGLTICYLEDQRSPATTYDAYLHTYERPEAEE